MKFILVTAAILGLATASNACDIDDVELVVDFCVASAKANTGGSNRGDCQGGSIASGISVKAPEGYAFLPSTTDPISKLGAGENKAAAVNKIYLTPEEEPARGIREFPIALSQVVQCKTGSGIGSNCRLAQGFAVMAVRKSCIGALFFGQQE